MPRTALITGGGSGIGRGVALALARRGVNVALAGRRPGRLEETARLASRYRVRAVPLPVDLSVASERRRLLGRVREALGPLDILVNNAATYAPGDLTSLTTDQIERAIAANLVAPMELTRMALPEIGARRGSIVLIASSTALVPLPYSTIYSATKAGIRAFAEALRYELPAKSVHLLLVYPPMTDTEMTQGMNKASGVPFPRANPDYVGERIVRALLKRKTELAFPGIDRPLSLVYRITPWLARAVLYSQRARFARMMAVRRAGQHRTTPDI